MPEQKYLHINLCYQFAEGKGLNFESQKIKSMTFMWERSYNTTVKRGCFFSLFKEFACLEEFLSDFWPFGLSEEGKNKIERELQIAKDYDIYLRGEGKA